MSSKFFLISTAIILLTACDRRAAEGDATKAAEIAAQQQAEQAANDKLRQIEDRLNAADQLNASEKDAELARLKEELAQVKREKDLAAQRLQELQNGASRPEPVAEGVDLPASAEQVEEDREPVYVGQSVPANQRVATVESFYEPLDRSGDWLQTDDYGYVFRPAVALRADWRPYTDGHWVHTAYGWTWESNEDFGWATYHYGRWVRVVSVGWVWVPGREWGPAWVSWRRGNEHCGWAPLPPESLVRLSFTASVDRDYGLGPAAYVFVTLANFGAHSYAPVIERPERNITIINKTVNVTNITYNNTTNNTTVYNGGPSYALLRARSQQPVENVQLKFAPAAPGTFANVRQGNNFQISAPPAAVAAKTAPPRVKEKLGKATEDKGWSGIDPAQAQKTKQEIAATSIERPRPLRPAPAVATPAGAGTPGATAASTPLSRPVHPTVAAPEAAKPVLTPASTPHATPRPEALAHPPVADKLKPFTPVAANPTPAAEVPPKHEKPIAPVKPVNAETPKMREPATPHPRVTPGPTPALNHPEEPKRPAESTPRPAVAKPATPKPTVAVPRREELPATPVVREPPKAPLPAEAKPPVPHEAKVTPRPSPSKKATPENDKDKKKDQQQ
jgi:hypothetical protein